MSNEFVPPPPPAKKFKIEMVVKKPKPVKKNPVKEKKIIKPKRVTPIKIKKSRPARSPQKIRKKEIAIQPVVQIVPAKPVMVHKNNVHPSKKAFQMAKADISANALAPRPRIVTKAQASNIITAKIQRYSTGKAKPAEFSPLPRPVKNVRMFSKVYGEKSSFHASAAGFAPSLPKPKSVSTNRVSQIEGRATTRIHDGQKVMASGLPGARMIAVGKTPGRDQKKAVEFKSTVTSRPMAPALAAIRPFTSKFESVTTPNRAAKFYEAKTRTVSSLPSAKVSSVSEPSNRMSGNNRRTAFVQKGELYAAATIPTPRPVPNIIDKGILNGYLGTLQALIASAKKYPESARQSGQEGKVTVQFTVMKNGSVKNIQLVSKTNYSDLDKEAIAAVKRAAPFSTLPEEIGKPFLDIILPFRFKLNE